MSIRFEQVTKHFPNTSQPAVNDCTLTVATGSFTVLVGTSGSGKSTLLKLVNRLYEPTSGTIWLDDQPIAKANPITLRRQIGYVIQQTGLFPHMTVAQNIAVVPRLLGWPREKITIRVNELLELVELPSDQFSNRYPTQLSGGQQQRVGVARGLAGNPALMLMDEPFGALDALTRTGLQTALLSLQRKLKKTILFVTHDIEEALRLADSLVILQAGKIIQQGTPLQVLLEPATPFVRDLLGCDDVLRFLSLVPVESVMTGVLATASMNEFPQIERTENLRTALVRLLQTQAPGLNVCQNGQPVGIVTFEQIRERIPR